MKLTYALLVAFGLQAGTAQAVPFVWFDEFDPADVTVSSQLSFTHSILDGASGFRPGIDSISKAFLNVVLADDALFGDLPFIGDGQETVSFNFDGTGWTSPQTVGFLDIFDFQFDTLLNDGMLGVVLRANQGDFKLAKSGLIVIGNRGTAAVSEPISLTLFGMGLLVLAAFAGRRTRGRTH